jgi:hypothetical protein
MNDGAPPTEEKLTTKLTIMNNETLMMLTLPYKFLNLDEFGALSLC